MAVEGVAPAAVRNPKKAGSDNPPIPALVVRILRRLMGLVPGIAG